MIGMEQVIHKVCAKCGILKPARDYCPEADSPDGLRYYCKSCNKATVIKWRQTHHADELRRVRAWRTEHRDKWLGSVKASKQRDIGKIKARRCVENAVRGGALIKPNMCGRCGQSHNIDDIHAHHHEYARPLSVVWLCRRCHGEVHRTINKEYGK